MFKTLAQIESKVGDYIAHLHLDPNTPVEIAEQLVVQYIQYFGKLKEKKAFESMEAQKASEVPDLKSDPVEPQPME